MDSADGTQVGPTSGGPGNSAAAESTGFDKQEAEAMLKRRYAEAMADPNLKEHTEKSVSAWGVKV